MLAGSSKAGSPTKHPRQLGEALKQFERTSSDLWQMMTQVNTEIMRQQAVGFGSGESGLSAALRSLGKTSQSQGSSKDDVQDAYFKASESMNVVSDAEKDLQDALSLLHQKLQDAFKLEVGGAQDAVVALEKARERLDMAKKGSQSAAKKGSSEANKQEIKARVAREVYDKHAAVVSDMLGRSRIKVEAVIAAGVAHYLRAKAKSLRTCHDEFQRLEFSLLPLEAAATEAGAMSSQTKVQSRRRQPAHVSPLLKTIVSTSFIASTAIADAASNTADNDDAVRDVLPPLTRLLDDLDLCFPLFKSLVHNHIKACNSLRDAPATLFHDSNGARAILTSCLELASRNKFFPGTFQGVLEDICSSYAAFAERGGDQGEEAELSHLFSQACHSFLNAAFRSVRDYPPFLRMACRHLYEVFGECGRPCQRQAAGSLVILCFLCPALISPGDYGVTRLKSVSRRILLLLCQALEQLVIGPRDSTDEFMTAKTQQILAETRPAYHQFLDILGEDQGGDAGEYEEGITSQSEEEAQEDLEIVAEFVESNWDAVHSLLASRGYLAESVELEAGLRSRSRSALPRQPRPQSQKLGKVAVKKMRVCTIPGLSSIKGKGRFLGIKYRNLRSDDEDAVLSDTDEDDNDGQGFLPEPSKVVSRSTAPRRGHMEDEVGVGIQFEADENGYLRVASLADGGPAERCGMIEIGDLLVQIDAQNIYVHDNPRMLLNSLIVGRAGSLVELGLQKEGTGHVRSIKLRRNDRYASTAPPAGVCATRAAQQPKVKVRNATFTKGKSEHTWPGSSQEGMVGGGGVKRGEDMIKSTGSIGSEKYEVSGVGIVWRMNESGLPVVAEVTDRGPAERNGCISHGDVCTAVDNVPLQGKPLHECAALLNGSMGSSCCLDLFSATEEERDQRVNLRRTWIPDVVWSASGDVCCPEPEATQEPGSDAGGKQVMHGVGITFKADGKGNFSVKRVAQGGPAEVAGTVHVGDVIKTVDGISVQRKSYRRFACMILGPMSSIVQLGIERGSNKEQHLILLERGPAASSVMSEGSSESTGSESPQDSPISSKEQVETAGVGVRCEADGEGGFQVKGVQPGGAADKMGLQVGDVIMAVDGKSTKGMTQDELRGTMIGAVGSVVELGVMKVADRSLRVLKICRESSVGKKPQASQGAGVAPASLDFGSRVSGEQSSSLEGALDEEKSIGDISVYSEGGDTSADGGGDGQGKKKKCGIGMTFKARKDTGMLAVNRIKEGGVAEKVGINVGDTILSIDGHSLQNCDKKRLPKIMLGYPGSVAVIELQRHGSTRIERVEVTRGGEAHGDGGASGDEHHTPVASEDSWKSVAPPRSPRSSSGSSQAGLGLTFAKPDGMPGVLIKRIKDGGAAEAAGRIRAGDRILMIDGKELVNVTSKELTALVMGAYGSNAAIRLQSADGMVSDLVIQRGVGIGSGSPERPAAPPSPNGSDQGLAPEPSLDFSVAGGFGSGKHGLGVTFHKSDGKAGVMIRRVKPGSIAALDGRLHPGDRIISIDGTNLPANISYSQLAKMVMGESGTVAVLVVDRGGEGGPETIELTRRRRSTPHGHGHHGGGGGVTSQLSQLSNDPESALSGQGLRNESSTDSIGSVAGEGEVKKGLGITFKQNTGNGVVVSRVKRGSPAESSGRIVSGDRILAVDDVDVIAVDRHVLATLVMGEQGTPCRLSVRHADGSTENITLYRGIASNTPPHMADDSQQQQTSLQAGGGMYGGELQYQPTTSTVSSMDEASVMMEKSFDPSGLDDEESGPVGLGMTFLKCDGKGGRVVKRVKDGSAAQVAGVRPGERCISIDGIELAGARDREIAEQNLGAEGSTCIVLLRHKGTMREVVLTRRRFNRPLTRDSCGLSEASFDASVHGGSPSKHGAVGLGITLHSWDGQDSAVRVKRIKDGGAAKASGQIAPGDMLMSIDGASVAGLSNRELAELVMGPEGSISVVELQARGGGLRSVMLTRCRPGSAFGQGDTESAQHAVLSPDRANDLGGMWPEEQGAKDTLSEVSVDFSVAGDDLAGEGDDDDAPKVKQCGIGLTFLKSDGEGVAVKRVKPGGPAQRCGQISPGDKVMSIDGVSVANISNSDLAVLVVGNEGTAAVLEVKDVSDGGPRRVEITRGTAQSNIAFGEKEVRMYDLGSGALSRESSRESLGSMTTDKDLTKKGPIPKMKKAGIGLVFLPVDGQGGVVVKRVKEGSACEGVVEAGDRVLAFDGDSSDNWTSQDLAKLSLGPEGSEVVLKIKRKGNPEAFELSVYRQESRGATVTPVMSAESISSVSSSQHGDKTKVGLGLTFLKPTAEGWPVKRVKDDGPAAAHGNLRSSLRSFVAAAVPNEAHCCTVSSCDVYSCIVNLAGSSNGHA